MDSHSSIVNEIVGNIESDGETRVGKDEGEERRVVREA